MCGIAGIISKTPVNPEVLENFSKLLKHRGPDDEGYFIEDSNNDWKFFKGEDTIPELSYLPHISSIKEQITIGMVHRRLSIIDLTEKGHQPMQQNSNYFISFNGEIYNYKELRTELRSYGYTFSSDSDTEVILASYMKWGMDFVGKFIGMWAFVLYDRIKNRCIFSRDRFGIKPLYILRNQYFISFASEAKAFGALSAFSFNLNHEYALKYFIQGGSDLNGESFFESVTELLPSHMILLDLNTWTEQLFKYYDLTEVIRRKPLYSSSFDYLGEFGDLMQNCVSLHSRSDVPVGNCLSGGLDSSLLVYLLSAQTTKYNLKTFTAAYSDASIDESHFARLLAGQGSVEQHFTYPTSNNFWQSYDSLIYHQDFPFHSSSIYAQYEVMKLASLNNIKVILDGQGADEILAGYSQFVGSYLFDLFTTFHFRRFLSSYSDLKKNYHSSPPLYDMARASFHSLPTCIQDFIYTKQRISPNLINKEARHQYDNTRFPKRIGRTIQETSLLQLQLNLPELLRYEDRNSMAFSIESRVPFLDHRIVEFSIALPDNLKIYNGWTKYILRKFMDKKMDDKIVWRREKKGFVTPQQTWLTELHPTLKEFINTSKIPSFLNIPYIHEIFKTQNFSETDLNEIWKIVSFIKWINVFNVNC